MQPGEIHHIFFSLRAKKQFEGNRWKRISPTAIGLVQRGYIYSLSGMRGPGADQDRGISDAMSSDPEPCVNTRTSHSHSEVCAGKPPALQKPSRLILLTRHKEGEKPQLHKNSQPNSKSSFLFLQ